MAKKKEAGSTSSSKKRINGCKKGKQFEREIANDLGHLFPEVKRKLEYQMADLADESGVDLSDCGPLKIQCKNKQNYVPVNTIREIITKDPSHIPVLVTKGNRMEAMAVVPWAKLVTLLEVAIGHRPPFLRPNLRDEVLQLGEPQKLVEAEAIEVEFFPAGSLHPAPNGGHVINEIPNLHTLDSLV